MKNPPERGCSGGWGNCWRLRRSAAVLVVLVPLIRRPILPTKFRKPSNEPHPGSLHSCSHGDLLTFHRVRTIPQRVAARSDLRHTSSGRPSPPAACSAGSSRHQTSVSLATSCSTIRSSEKHRPWTEQDAAERWDLVQKEAASDQADCRLVASLPALEKQLDELEKKSPRPATKN
jgi:hypothetical protein